MGVSLNNALKFLYKGLKVTWLNLLIKVGIIITAYWALYTQIFQKHKLDELVASFEVPLKSPQLTLLTVTIVALMLVNWSLEALKWRMLILKVQNLSFLKSFRAVMAGVTISMFTPNRTGEYFGRIFILESGHRWEGVFITIIGSLSQLLVTLLIGIPAFFIFLISFPAFEDVWVVSALEIALIPLTVIALALLLMFLNIGYLTRWANRLIRDEWVKLRRYLQVFAFYKRHDLMPVIGMSALRYLVFSLQFLLLLRLFGIPVTIPSALVALPSIFLVTTVFPSLTLAELGLRGTVSAFVLSAMINDGGDYNLQILAASGSLWLLNLVIPAMIGSVIIAGMRFIKVKQEEA